MSATVSLMEGFIESPVLVALGVSALWCAGLVVAWLYRARSTTRRRSLSANEDAFLETVDALPASLCCVSRDGLRITHANKRFAELTGRTRAQLEEEGLLTLVHHEDVSIARGLVGELRDNSRAVCEYRLVKPDGGVVYVTVQAASPNGVIGKASGVWLAHTDVTPHKQAEKDMMAAKQQAETANIAKTRLLAAASHDLRQPIQAMNLFQDALNRTELRDEQKTIARFLSMSVNSLGELLYSLLDISKLDAGMIRPVIKETLVEDLFGRIDEAFSTVARQRNLRFKLFYSSTCAVLLTDQGLLLSVLRNLIDNAFKYTESGGVLVGVRRRGDAAVIQVWDTGIGIERKYGDRVFDECFQIGNPLHDRSQGLGIGLSIARRLARLLGSDVTFRSRPGRGTVFEIVLPLAPDQRWPLNVSEEQEAPLPLTEDEPDHAHLVGRQVVVIEDDPVVAKSVELSLQAVGVAVVIFGSAEEALRDPRITAADFYICDLVLPGTDGLELLDKIQQRSRRSIHAVLMTGQTGPEKASLTASSPWPVLFKPTDLARILTVMSEAFERSR